MQLKTILDQLTQGELRSLSLGGYEGDEILPSDYAKLIGHINLGLTELHKRLPLLTKIAYIDLIPEVGTYYLDKAFWKENTHSGELYKYIVNPPEYPFFGNVMKIERIFECTGTVTDPAATFNLEVPYNDKFLEDSIWVNEYNSIQVRQPLITSKLAVVYRADHEPIILEDYAHIYQEVHLPHAYLEPLLLYVAARATAGMDAVEGVRNTDVYAQKFELAMMQLTKQGMYINDNTKDNKFISNGWV